MKSWSVNDAESPEGLSVKHLFGCYTIYNHSIRWRAARGCIQIFYFCEEPNSRGNRWSKNIRSQAPTSDERKHLILHFLFRKGVSICGMIYIYVYTVYLFFYWRIGRSWQRRWSLNVIIISNHYRKQSHDDLLFSVYQWWIKARARIIFFKI